MEKKISNCIKNMALDVGFHFLDYLNCMDGLLVSMAVSESCWGTVLDMDASCVRSTKCTLLIRDDHWFILLQSTASVECLNEPERIK